MSGWVRQTITVRGAPTWRSPFRLQIVVREDYLSGGKSVRVSETSIFRVAWESARWITDKLLERR